MSAGMVVDISESGMRIESPVGFPVNSVLTIYVQFPRHTVRLRARTIWTSAMGECGPHVIGLALTQAEPTLRQAFAEWVAEVQKTVAEDRRGVQRVPGVTSSSGADPAPAGPTAEAEPQQPAPRARQPLGPIKRRLESRQGHAYDALLEREASGWRLTIVQTPRQIGIGEPDLQDIYPDYSSAEDALREFVRNH